MRKRKTRRKRRPGWMIPSPVTERKIRNRGFKPICYVVGHGKDGVREVRFGWQVKETPTVLKIAFPSSEQLTHVHGEDRRYVIPIEDWRRDNVPPPPKEEAA